MKKIFTIFCLALMPFLTNTVLAQDTLAAWTFPSTSADSLVDVAIALNASRYISCQYGTSGAPSFYNIPIDYTTNGSLGAPDKCAKAVGWDNAVDSIYWIVKFKSTGYGNITLYSKQQAGGSNPGPRDFQVQWKLSGTTVWNDLTGGTLVCANNWTSAAVSGISLPSNCDNQSNSVSIRWLIKSNFDINGNALDTTGISKIDDIIIIGTPLTGIHETETQSFISIYPNPNKGNFSIENKSDINKIEVFNILGKRLYVNENVALPKTELSGFLSGMYLVQLTSNNNKIYTYKIIVE